MKCTGSEASYIKGCRCKPCSESRSTNVKRRKEEKRIADLAKVPKRKMKMEMYEYCDTWTREGLYRARGWDLP